MTDIKLYLGAHKTATTHLQGMLLESRNYLSGNNITITMPRDVRKKWLPEYFQYCAGHVQDGNALDGLKSIVPDSGTWILSEENILGVSNDLTNKMGLYPNSEARLKCLVEMLGVHNYSLYFSLRSYESFYGSAYSEVVRNRGYIPFDKFYDEDRFRDNSWVKTISMFQRVLPQNKIVIWRYEDFRSLVTNLVSLLTGLQDSSELLDAYKPETTRPSLSDKTIEIMGELSPAFSRIELKRMVERINTIYSLENGYSQYAPFSSEQAERFRRQYDDDVETIKIKFPDIMFLEP